MEAAIIVALIGAGSASLVAGWTFLSTRANQLDNERTKQRNAKELAQLNAQLQSIQAMIRNLTRGHDIFLTFTERLLCLITALEAVLGPFGDGRLESRLTQTYLIFRGKADRTTARIEPELRRVRNAVAHGADYRRDLDYKGVSELLRDVLRIGLPPLIRLATSSGARALELATEEGDEGLPPPSIAFQRLLDRSVAGDQESRRALVELR